MNKNLLLFLIIVLLLGILGYLKYKKNQTQFSNVEFRIDDIQEVNGIYLEDKYGNKTKLTKKGYDWFVNDSLPAESSKIQLILEAIQKIQIDLPVNDSLRPTAIDDLRKFGLKVQILDKEGDELKSYFIGSTQGSGNYMILSENGIVSPEPYIVKMPGIQKGDIKYRYLAHSPSWYSSSIFKTTIDKIQQIKVNYTNQPYNSFVLDKDEELIQINPLLDSVKIKKQLNKEAVLGFLLEFEKKHFETNITEDSVIQKIKSLPVYATIELIDVYNKKQSIILYRKPPRENVSLKDAQGKDLPFDVERYWAFIPTTKQYVQVQHYVFGPILLPYTYFFEDNK